MSGQGTAAKFHVLLIGIDNYKSHELRGCVNDIDAIQDVLIRRMAIPKDRIRRLASPLPGDRHDPTIDASPATLANLRSALARLASDEGDDKVNDGDRVFIYYSGHGKRVSLTAGNRTFYREALVPEDFAAQLDHDQYLYDFDVNELLGAIVKRTRSVTVMLDCCHAASATRGDGLRTFLTGRPVPLSATSRGTRGLGGEDLPHGVLEGVDACQVVSACLADEYAREDFYDGKRHGLLTHAFITALGAVEDAALDTLTWAQIWQPVRAKMKSYLAAQNPELTGNLGRVVFAGPQVDGDPGIPVTYDADDDNYHLAAGTMAEVTEDAILAIYDREPREFPRRNSDEDRAARIGLVRVRNAQPAASIATAITQAGDSAPGRPLPPGARARLIKAGKTAPLRYAVTPGHPEVVINSDLLARAGDGEQVDVRLELCGGRWLLTDDEHTNEDGAAVLCALRPEQIGLAREILEHYRAYSLPLRIAKRATRSGTGDLQLSVRSVDGALTPEQAQAAVLPEVKPGGGRYTLTTGARVCFQVRNVGPETLRVTLVNVAASGRVQWLGDQTITAGADQLFWSGNGLGTPFEMSPAEGHSRGIDRVVAIGRSDKKIELNHLVTDTRFRDILLPKRDAGASYRDMQGPLGAKIDRWAAAIAVLDTRTPPTSARSARSA